MSRSEEQFENELDFRKCKRIDLNTKDSVFGFVREMENTLCQKNIPELIPIMCLLYFFENDDEWDIKEMGKSLKVLDDNKTILRVAAGIGVAFLSNIVGHGIHKWKFRLNHLNKTGFNGILGLFTLNSNNLRRTRGRYNLSDSNGMSLETGRYNKLMAPSQDYAIECKSGDIIEMIADIEQGLLKYIINDKDYGKMCDINCDEQYVAAVCFYSANDSLTLL